MSIIWLRPGCESRLASYGSKRTSRFLFYRIFVATCTSTHYLNTILVQYGCSILHMKRVLYYTTFLWCGLELHERFNWKPTTPDMHHSCSLIQRYCVYTASSYIHCYLLCNYAWQQNSHTLWLHTTHRMMVLLPTLHNFIRTDLNSYSIHVAVFFQLHWKL